MPCLELEESREKKKRNENERKMGGKWYCTVLKFPISLQTKQWRRNWLNFPFLSLLFHNFQANQMKRRIKSLVWMTKSGEKWRKRSVFFSPFFSLPISIYGHTYSSALPRFTNKVGSSWTPLARRGSFTHLVVSALLWDLVRNHTHFFSLPFSHSKWPVMSSLELLFLELGLKFLVLEV